MIRTREKKEAQMKNGTHQFTQKYGIKVKNANKDEKTLSSEKRRRIRKLT